MQHLITATIHYKYGEKCIYGIICSRFVVASMSSDALIVYVHIYIYMYTCMQSIICIYVCKVCIHTCIIHNSTT